ncbi:11737_t:CDS:2 [Diversispora eburnea]|uniref:11737_t:CDS:1 n=1 Tax=Diversispora eburnea TaxID=1213867 RepID=A0A9N8YW33_9GLOM|nr:11737_t:CDS:2 [Diversispora eburnea]
MKKRSNILLSLFMIFLLLQDGVFASQTTNCNTEKTFCITITLPSSSSDVVKFKMVAPSTVGWIAVGIGSSMIGSYMVMAWPTTTNTVAISQRIAYSYSIPAVTTSQSDITVDTSSGVSNGQFIVSFSRPATVVNSTVTSSTTAFIWGMQSTTRPEDNPSTTVIAKHDSIGRITLTGGLSTYDKYIISHGLIMFLTWGLIVPGAIFIARFARNVIPQGWFRLHWGIQLFLAAPLLVIGLLLAIGAGVKFNPGNTHEMLGVILIGLFFGQLTLGWIHHKLYDSSRKYIPWWTKLHWWWGRIIALLGFVQITLGLGEYNVGKTLVFLLYTWVIFIIVSYIGLAYFYVNKRRSEIKALGRSDIVYTGVGPDDGEHLESLMTSSFQ